MPLARCGILAIALAGMIGSVSPAEEPTTRDSKAAARALPYMAFRSFRHEERFNRQFAEAGCIPSTMLRSMAEKAGVHIYNEKADALYANENLLAIHTDEQGGERSIALPRAARVVELFSGRVVSDQPVRRFTDELPPLSTRLYHLTQPGRDEVRITP